MLMFPKGLSMATDYWIKLYNEILNDPKMALLPDRIWRRTIELFLVASELGGNDRTGKLPETKQIAWVLRMKPEELELDLVEIEKVGIIQRVDDGWLVTNFSKRQGAVPSTERWQHHRDRKRKDEYYANETQTIRLTDTDKDKEEEEDTDKDTEAAAAAASTIPGINNFKTWYENIGTVITPALRDKILFWDKEYSAVWVDEAIKETGTAGAKSPNYTEAILKRWSVQGFKSKPPNHSGNGRGKSKQATGVPTIEERKKYAEQLEEL